LLWFWRADRAGAFEMPAFETANAQARHELTAATGDPLAQLRAIEEMRRGGAPKQALQSLDALLAQYPRFAEGYLQRALIFAAKRGGVNREAADTARQALALGLREPSDAALAQSLIAFQALERGDGATAQAAMDAALTPAPGYDPELLPDGQRAELHALRGQAYRRQGRYDDAYREVGLALALALAAGHNDTVARLRQEQEIIEKHAGRKLSAAPLRSEPTFPSSDGR